MMESGLDSWWSRNYPTMIESRTTFSCLMRRFLASIVLVVSLAPSLGFAVDKISVLGLFKDKAIINVDGKQRVLKVGEPSPEGIVLISANSEEAVMEVDGETASYRLGSHIGTIYDKPAEGPVVQIWPDSYGMYNIIGNINSYPVTFLVDTGATLIAINKNEARRLATVVDGDFPTEVLLGNSFLNRLEMRREGKMLELKKKY